uniref:Uncharacterized protein n=1 Tax=Rhizophora mucronata TaxID=61149 RepID=A0A2P2PY15_RHIMU
MSFGLDLTNLFPFCRVNI